MDTLPKATLRPGRVHSGVNHEFLNWLRFVNPGMLVRGNVELFAYCVDNLPSNSPILEIGTFAGLSLNHLVFFVRKSNRNNPVFSVDPWHFEGALADATIPGSSISFDVYRSHVIDTFRRNVTLFSGGRLPHHFELSSDEFFSHWKEHKEETDYFGSTVKLGGPISLAYLDGDHRYEQSKRDFSSIDHYLEVGGFVIFDDSAPLSRFGCKKTAEEAASLPQYEVVTRNPNYCLRKRTQSVRSPG